MRQGPAVRPLSVSLCDRSRRCRRFPQVRALPFSRRGDRFPVLHNAYVFAQWGDNSGRSLTQMH